MDPKRTGEPATLVEVSCNSEELFAPAKVVGDVDAHAPTKTYCGVRDLELPMETCSEPLPCAAHPAPPEGTRGYFIAPPETHPETCPMSGSHTRTACNWQREQLARYAQHLSGCTRGTKDCSCGLLQMLDARPLGSTAASTPEGQSPPPTSTPATRVLPAARGARFLVLTASEDMKSTQDYIVLEIPPAQMAMVKEEVDRAAAVAPECEADTRICIYFEVEAIRQRDTSPGKPDSFPPSLLRDDIDPQPAPSPSPHAPRSASDGRWRCVKCGHDHLGERCMASRFVDGRPLPAPWIKRMELGVETIVCGCEETAPPNHAPRPEGETVLKTTLIEAQYYGVYDITAPADIEVGQFVKLEEDGLPVDVPAEGEQMPVVYRRLPPGEIGQVYALYGSSSIAYADALEKDNARFRAKAAAQTARVAELEKQLAQERRDKSAWLEEYQCRFSSLEKQLVEVTRELDKGRLELSVATTKKE